MKKIFYLFAITTVLFSCQKVIDVDLNEANPTPVLEGIYTAEDSTVRVKLSLTSSYFNDSPSTSIDAAVVNITDGAGITSNVPSIGNGNYELQNYIPNFNTTYTLSVLYDGVTYSAECDLADTVSLDDITYEYFPGFFGGDPGYVVYLNFQDPANTPNFYQIILSLNGEEFGGLEDMFTQDDLLSDGNPVERPLFSGDFFQIGDTVGMELRSVDEDVYYYINEAISIVGGSASAAPANPTTNWNNKALGYFSAYGNSRKEVIIQ
ncbi:MAG: DUF4249 domain-containing protein [Crocinitomicaceae bacterium]|jgi:hypothetical protein